MDATRLHRHVRPPSNALSLIQRSPNNDLEIALLYPALGAVIGCWSGAIPIPLDWDRPWQVSPSPLEILVLSSMTGLANYVRPGGRRGACDRLHRFARGLLDERGQLAAEKFALVVQSSIYQVKTSCITACACRLLE